MGLDAAVYRGGPAGEVRAGHFRLGNVALIAALRAEVDGLLGADTVLARKVLYSGSHAGDALEVADLQQIEAELDSLAAMSRASGELAELVRKLRQLTKVARKENSPIVFE